jgi:glycosyltransferase involved in cell wall biosynthesis
MDPQPTAQRLRVALFSGNYNYVKDGANQALNRLVGRIEARGAVARVYSPIGPRPAFAPTGTLIPVPSIPIPGRPEYRAALGLPRAARRDLGAFAPHIVHLAAPDILGHAARRWAGRHRIPAVASVHTRFETYFDYYGLGFVRHLVEGMQRRFYSGLAEIYAPSESMARVLREGGYSDNVRIWSRGVDHHLFRPEARDPAWRGGLGLGDEPTILFVARLVLEKGLDILAAVAAGLTAAGVRHRILVVGDGPARGWIEERLPGAIFTGFLTGADLARAYASADIFFNPSVTETFGNVTLEAMASGLAVVAARAPGTLSLVEDGANGLLIAPRDVDGFARALATYATDPDLRHAAGREGRRRAQPYDWDRVNDALIERYFALTGHNAAPAQCGATEVGIQSSAAA